MIQRLTHRGLAMAVLLIGLAPAYGQTDLDLMTKPKTVPEFWRQVQFQLSQGKFDVAAEYLKGLMAANPTDKDLLTIAEREGIDKFLDLRNVLKWSDNPKLQADAKQNVEKLIAQVSDARRKLLSDPDRIARFVKNLSASAEEREYAIAELQKSGAAIMPTLLGAIVSADQAERLQLLSVLPLLDSDTVPAVLATMDVNSDALKLNLMDSIVRRSDLLKLMGRSETDPRPTLWHLAAKDDLVGRKAKEILATLVALPAAKLPAPVSELIKAADSIYQHKATYSRASDAPPVWRWDGKQLTSTKLPPTQVEEYFGLRYARWALELEPKNEAAQVLFLSIATEKALERVGLDKKLSQSAPAVHEMLALAPASVLYAILDKAIAEAHLAVAIGVTQVLGERAETKGVPTGGTPRTAENTGTAPPPLVAALNSKDRRLSIAAADALIKLPGTPTHRVSARVVEVYRAALANPVEGGDAAGARPKALIADANAVRADLLANTVRQAGFDAEISHTGRDALRRLTQASDIDVLWVDHLLPYPELPHFIAQVRSDFKHGLVPMFVTIADDMDKAVLPELEVRLNRLTRSIADLKIEERSLIRVAIAFDALKINRQVLNEWLDNLARERPTVRTTTDATLVIRLALDRSKEQEAEMLARLREMTQDLFEVRVKQDSPTRFSFSMDGNRPVPEELESRLARFQRDFPNVVVTRELPTKLVLTSSRTATISPQVADRLARSVEPYKFVQVIPRPVTPEAVREEMELFIADASTRPLTDAERKDQQKRAVEALRKMATGELPGYDVRPAAGALRAAMRSDDLAAAAVEAVSRLPGKVPQQDLADLTLDSARKPEIRVKAANGLTHHIQLHQSAPLSDAQVQNLIKTYESDPAPEVRAAVAAVLGVLPQDRVLKNLADDTARKNWTNRLQKYEPKLSPAAPAPAPGPAVPPPKPGGDKPKDM